MPKSEILIIDDSPNNDIPNIIAKSNLSNIDVFSRDEKSGRGSAVLLGLHTINLTSKSFVVEMDADFSHSPDEIPGLLKKAINDGADMVIASRYLNASSITNWPIARRIFSKISNLVAKSVLRIPVSDYTNGFRVYNEKAVSHINDNCGQIGGGFIALSEILFRVHQGGFVISEVPSRFVNRTRGESSVTRNEVISAVFGLWKLFLIKARNR